MELYRDSGSLEFMCRAIEIAAGESIRWGIRHTVLLFFFTIICAKEGCKVFAIWGDTLVRSGDCSHIHILVFRQCNLEVEFAGLVFLKIYCAGCL